MNKETQHTNVSNKKETNSIDIPAISLPKGGGAIRNIDEKFSVNAVNGTAGITIPLPVSPARGCSPALTLSYNSGSGNGVFGLGWQLSLASIRRRTSKQLPRYFDGEESDVFVLSDAEDLVPEFDRSGDGSFLKDDKGDYVIKERNSPDNAFTIRFYRPRIEQNFATIERWYAKDQREIKWRLISKDNITTLFGWSPGSRIADPADASRIYQWLPELVFDDKGNCCRYIYKKEDDTGLDLSLLHNKNRVHNGTITYTNCYLEKVLYCNKQPYKKFGDVIPAVDDFLFETAFDYGTLDPGDQPGVINNWDYRPDAFSDYTAGFEIRTTRLCKRVLLFHHFNGANEYNGLVRLLDLEYDKSVQQGFTFLQSATLVGYIKQPDNTYSFKKLPSLEFMYQQHDWNAGVQTVATDVLVHAPAGIGSPSYLFTDLYNEGLAGILAEQATGWYYKHNLGVQSSATGDEKLVFENAKLVSPKPSFKGLGNSMQLTDLDADGGKQFTNFNSGPKGFFELNDDNEWQSFKSFSQLPNVDLTSPFVKMIDLNGDGKAELVFSEDDAFTWYPSAGRNGFASARKTGKAMSEEDGPYMVFADDKQSIFLADMTGDGLTDIVRIRNGEVCYWPNLGYGRFGKKIAMEHAPVFDLSDAFNPSLIRLADIDGSGTTDIIYLGKNRFSCWLNYNGNRFAVMPYEIESFPEIHSAASITVTDLLGNGVACIVWSSPLEKDAHASLKYIDLMNGKKPHLLVKYQNNLGREISMEYTASTKYYIADRLQGRPWITKLHFPVHCLSRTIVADRITGHRFTSSYTYHHGYYDHTEREFRGFGMVEQTDAETFDHWKRSGATNITEMELHQEPVISKQWFHTGAWLRKEIILSQFEHEYWYNEMARRGFPMVQYEKQLEDARIIPGKGVSGSYTEQLCDEEYRQAFRACKGMALRSELFAYDAAKYGNTPETVKKEGLPYEVSTHNCVIEMLQPKGQNNYAVFVVKESEKVSYNYERSMEDPRIAHTLNIRLDEYGNILETASVSYPRKKADVTLSAEVRIAQQTMAILYTVNNYTNDVLERDVNRGRMLAETKTYELKGVGKPGEYYDISDFNDILLDTRSDGAAYHEINKLPTGTKALRRLTAHKKMLFYSNDLVQSLPLYRLESKGIAFETYQLAYTPALLADLLGSKINNALMLEGGFTHAKDEWNKEDENWWVRSGTKQYIGNGEEAAAATSRFYMPVSFIDPFGATTKVTYYGAYNLMIEETENALGNTCKVLAFNFRTLSPASMQDVNRNRSEVLCDELGFVKAMAVMGKGNQADDLVGLPESSAQETALVQHFFNAPVTTAGITDSVTLMGTAGALLQHASTRFVYDLDVYRQTGKPAVVASITRETHYRDENGNLNPESKLQIAYEYGAGNGKVVMKKVQAEPGMAKRVRVMPDNTITVEELDTTPLLRWIGNGKTVVNNKGNVVKQYEPYFSITNRFEDTKELVETGVTPVLYYDALNRLVRTDSPDGTFTKIEFDNWKQVHWDANDTVLESDWYQRRTDHTRTDYIDDIKEQQAAQKAALHAATPAQHHFDPLAHPVLMIEHNKELLTGANQFYHSTFELDPEGNLRSVTDARGNVVMRYKYDMLGNSVYQTSMDTGKRWLLTNILGKPLRTWDERDHEFRYEYDILHRPVQSRVVGGDGPIPLDHIFDKMVYGELQPDAEEKNRRGLLYQHYDTGGLLEMTDGYDFKGKPVSVKRKLFKKYKEVVNWSAANQLTDLEPEEYVFVSHTDALGRIVQQTAPDGSIITPAYNEAGLLNAERVEHSDPGQTVTYIKNIDYNEKGQRCRIVYGNDVVTSLYYDPHTFRLKRLESKRKNNDPLQHWYYTFDAAGNTTHIEDRNIPQDFFRNNKTTGVAEYTYDALYRLTEATGREHESVPGFGSCDNWCDKAFMHWLNPGDPIALRTYRQKYTYDNVGNILEMRHVANGGSYTRTYAYETTNNRLQRTAIGNISSPENYEKYNHHSTHGFMTELPHLEKIGWNFMEQVVLTTRQHCTEDNIPVTTYYQYDGQGQRIRKITENQAPANQTPAKKEERIYIAGYELYKKHSGADAGLERASLSLMDQGHRYVMIETRNEVNDGTKKQVVRYQLHNQLGSTAMELDAVGDVISYEEYHPFGTTAYQANNNTIKTAYKRYRFTGMERDEETGLEYHSARYYLPWLGRWLSGDPAGIQDGLNVFGYCKNNPLMKIDKNGKQGMDANDIGMGMMWDRVGGELSSMWSSMFGGSAYVNPVANKVNIYPAQGGVGGFTGGMIRAASFRLIPLERNPNMSSLYGAEQGAGVLPVADPFMRLATAETVTGLEASRLEAGAMLLMDVVPLALEARAAYVEMKASRTTVSLAYRPGKLAPRPGPIGHNIVGINEGNGTKWSHLVVGDAERTKGIITNGKAIVEAYEKVPAEAKYKIIEIPVTPEQVAKAQKLVNERLGNAGTYKLFDKDCTTYAHDILTEAGISMPGISTPSINAMAARLNNFRFLGAMAEPAAAMSLGKTIALLSDRYQMSVTPEFAAQQMANDNNQQQSRVGK
ncbi:MULTISPECIES: SpvB/TcaC N-terminal domain-containing protein [Niastella]|uniref:Insecticidal toxin complex protein n=1 Tax=Niastella soli TaxID=2821487 RepID=A0ABS3YZH8_9BACT|nr:SpvB/TcaC N-terminal domain-containing protein [Niastella soli]MBO9202541.1 hypothetical protein [Niastella soli]